MSFPYLRGLVASEVAFLCEMELVTIIPRQRLGKLELLGGITPSLYPSRRAQVPLWLALLLKRQKRARIVPPAWLNADNLSLILEFETDAARDTFTPPLPLSTTAKGSKGDATASEPELKFTLDGDKYYASPPFVLQNDARDELDGSRDSDAAVDVARLPYHWLELGTMLLDAASDDIAAADQVRVLMKELREARMEKMRGKVTSLDATSGSGGAEGLALTGAGAMEIAETRLFMSETAEVLRQLGTSKEETWKERIRDEGSVGGESSSDDEMQFSRA
ncbi:DNA replication protein psf2 [Ascosphaera acerosa]|nr:DNA replication protein psf2 [Ascosphaera acerosa]